MRTALVCIAAALALGARPPQHASVTALTGAPVDHVVTAGESLTALAAQYGMDASTIARRNGLRRGAALKAGAILRIDAVHIVPSAEPPIVVNVPQRMLFVTAADGVHAFPIAVGRRGWETPSGAFTVVVKETDPTWDVPVSIQEEMRRAGKPVVQRVPPSPGNPLGAYWLGLSLPGIGIHGTNAPHSIYQFATHGCIRVHPARVAELFALVPEGAQGVMVYEPLLLAVSGGRVYLEAHPDPYGRSEMTLARVCELADAAGALALVDWTRAAAALARREGIAVDISGGG